MGKQSTVYLGPFSSEPFAEGLRVLLSGSGEFRVIMVEDADSLVTGIGEESAILVLEGTDPSMCGQYLALETVRMVVLIDPAAALAFVGVDNPRWEELDNVIRLVVDDANIRSSRREEDRVQIVDAATLPPDYDLTGRIQEDDLEPLMQWLEIRLAWRLSQRGDDVSPGVLGWSVTPRQALNMLMMDPFGATSPLSEKNLEARLKTCENDLFVTGRTLPPILSDIKNAFDLSSEDLRFLGLVLAPEIEGRYATAIGVLQDDLTRRRPGLTLMAELLSDTEVSTWDLRRRLHRPDSLVAKGLVRVEPEGLAVDSALVPSAAVVAHVLSSSPDWAAEAIGAKWWPPTADPEPPLSLEEAGLVRQLQVRERDPGTVRLVGGDHSKRWFGRVASGAGLALLVGNLDAVGSGADRSAAVSDWSVLSRLVDGTLLLLGTNELTDLERGQIAEIIQYAVSDGRLVVADGDLTGDRREAGGLVLAAPETSAAQRSEWWSVASLQVGLLLSEGDTDRLAATVNLEPECYVSATAMAVRLAAAGVERTLVELVQRSARDISRCEMPTGVRCIEPIYSWDDIVVEDENRILLESIPQHVLYEGRVMEEWGFSARMAYGRGISALFSGPSGTGKTMAAQIIAKDLGVDLLQVDLSKTVSKYIGETEKNLDKVFETAECRGSVLLFDEADAIFGRRTEIKDAHDRHANVEVAYLLQRLEAFRGLTILTTNLKQNIDNAFARRLRFVVDFALPTSAERAKIWHMSFPEGVLDEGGPDMATVASRLPIAGGSIQNIALHAAFLAAPDGEKIGARHLLVAMRRELLKMGMRSAISGLDDLMPALAGPDGYDHQVAP